MKARVNTTIDKSAPPMGNGHGGAEPVSEETRRRCIHDVQMVNEVTERLLRMRAVADLMFCARGDLAEGTMNNLGWLLIDMIDETTAIVCETTEVPA